MNTARNLARCSRLVSCRGICTTRTIGKHRLISATINNTVSKQSIFTHVVRPMSSVAKFEVIIVQDDQDFQKRVVDKSSSVPVVVDFHATWCGPCKLLGPRLEQLLSKEEGKVLMAKVDIDENPELAMEFGVQSVPTVVGMKNGKIQDKFVGVIDDDQISTFVDKLVVS